MDCPKKESRSGMANKMKRRGAIEAQEKQKTAQVTQNKRKTQVPKRKVGPAQQIKSKNSGIKAQQN